jgi:hypothetical protein
MTERTAGSQPSNIQIRGNNMNQTNIKRNLTKLQLTKITAELTIKKKKDMKSAVELEQVPHMDGHKRNNTLK